MAEAEEVNAFIRNAEEQLVDAEVTLRSGRYHLSFLCSALSAENASSALIIVLGRRTSRKHRNWMILGEIHADLSGRLGATVRELSLKLFRFKEKWLIPSEYYTKKMAEDALRKAKQILKLTKKCLKELSRGG
ncbi:MAG: HEPN domain-containing protein [Candidatus Freyarchaeota archaeon]